MKQVLLLVFVLCYYTLVFAQEVTVHTTCGDVVGKYADDHELFEYLGIPYAAPPVDDLRWQPTKSLEEAKKCWNGTYQAFSYQSMCPQVTDGILYGSEDCLFLNVWSANAPGTGDLLPVMVYIHGGGLLLGSGDTVTTVPWRFAKDARVVSVSINYRLNAIGFLALDVLSSHDVRGVSGNYGFLDQIEALKWVQQNIAAFGGDPSRVTIWGQSSGGTSVIALLMSPLASGLFHRAITMSGSPLIAVPLEEAEQTHKDDWLKNTRCSDYANLPQLLLNCLYNLTAEEIVQGVDQTLWNPAWLFGLPAPGDIISPLPVIDGVLLPYNMTEAFAKAVNDVPVMFGVMHEESDLGPVEIVFNYTTEEYTQFIMDKFEPFGQDFGAKVLDVYPLQNFVSPQQHYDAVSTDVGVLCGNLFLAQQAATSFESPIYMYIATQFPQVPKCFDDIVEGLGYCPQYAYHTWDQVVAMDDLGILNLLTIQEREYGKIIRNNFLDFAVNGKVNRWVQFNASPRYPETYYATNLKIEESIWQNPKKEECAFWHKEGFDWRWWQN